jgi:hypothetical protein
MTYNVDYSDASKDSIPVYDNTLNQDTSLRYPGRSYPSYGKYIADNFLHLLENFASDIPPTNPVEGQLWYDSDNGYLKIWDNTNWQAASNISKNSNRPDVNTAKSGELWIDMSNQQLNIFNGTDWVLIGPSVSTQDGRVYGTIVENVKDTDNVERYIVTVYIAGIPIAIISKDTFTPNPKIIGYDQLSSGINLNTGEDISNFFGDVKPQLIGTATTASALSVNGFTIPATKFLRSDIISTTDNAINIRHDSGITIGADLDFSISYTTSAAKLYNTVSGSGIELQTKNAITGLPNSTLKILNDKVTINTDLNITGSATLAGKLLVNDTNNDSIKTYGGMDVKKTITARGDLSVTGLTTVSSNVIPASSDTITLGSSGNRWKSIYVKSLFVDELTATNATSATKLANTTNFSIDGDVTSTSDVIFDGNGTAKKFTTKINKSAITGQTESNTADNTDMILVYQGTALKKMQRGTFLTGIIPTGTILPYAGLNSPSGDVYLLCDGREVDQVTYPDLYNIISNTYGTAATGKFKLPNLRAVVTPTTIVSSVSYIIKT